MSRAARYTIETAKQERWSDFLTNFDRNPVTNYLGRATNEQAVAGSLRNLLLTPEGHWPFESSVGSKVAAALFEFNDPRMVSELRDSIAEVINNHEPRVNLEEVITDTRPSDPHAIYVTLYYTIINIPDRIFDLDVVVTRVR